MANPIASIILTAVDKTKAAFESAKSRFDDLKSKASATLAGLGVGLSLAGLVGSVKNAAEKMDEAAKSARSAGTSIEKFSALSYVAGQSGVEDLRGSLVKLARSLDDAKNGTGPAAEAFQRLKIDPAAFTDPADALLALSDQFAKMPDGVTKTALAIALFGKSGADLIPLLNQGREAITATMNEARAMGIVFTDEAGAAAEKFNDSLDRLSKRVSGLGVRLANEALPSLNQYVSALDDVISRGSTLDKIKFFTAGYISEDVMNRITDAGERVKDYDKKIQELTQHLKERQAIGIAGPLEVKELQDLIAEYTNTRNSIAEADRKANAARSKSAEDTAGDIGKSYKAEAEDFKKATNEKISDAKRLQGALQSAFQQALSEEDQYTKEAKRLRDKASQPAGNQNQDSIRYDATVAALKLQRLKENGTPDEIRQQADAVRELASSLQDKAFATDLAKQADAAQATAADKQAKEAKDRAAGLAEQLNANESRMAGYQKALAEVDKPVSLDIVPTKATDDSIAKLREAKALIEYINNTPANMQVNAQGDAAALLRTEALKFGRR